MGAHGDDRTATFGGVKHSREKIRLPTAHGLIYPDLIRYGTHPNLALDCTWLPGWSVLCTVQVM